MRRRANSSVDAAPPRLGTQQRPRCRSRPSSRSKRSPLDLVPGQQRAQPPDHFAGAQVVAADVGEDLQQLVAPVSGRTRAASRRRRRCSGSRRAAG
ncbi:MAG: hypothetical protein MZW92_10800 [Comamonadaceae bacterium]|nr:hypothetical protein [Comamonadaceae bacterium]